jgi:hypothetical protein
LLPSREEEMLSDSITFAGHTITQFQLLGLGALLLGVAAFLMAFARERKTSLKRSDVTNELIIEMSRIAQALERIADQGASQMMRRAAKEAEAAQQPLPAPRRIAYSMFGR